MSSQASTSTSAMDVEPAANSPMTPGTPGNDETDHDEHPRKRRRASKKPRRMAGFLSGIVHVPMDIFAQITSHLYPIDIHALARTSKKFRMLLMNRSSRHIWLAAERNVPGLPPCPEHITSPEYAALVFGRWCSMCATTANVPRRMDEMLAVKLCSNCREKNIVGISFIARSVLPFVRLSHAVKQPTNNNRAYGLMNEVDWVVSIVFDLAARGETATLEKWKIERVAQLKKQAEFSRALVPFLDAMEDQRDDEIEELKAKRFAAIKEKLLESGWEEIDCQITHFPVLREWEKIVGVPKQLTNRTWENIKPKLEPILRANKQARLARERKERKQARKSRLCKLASDIGQAEAQVIALAEHPEESLVVPFPKDSQVLKLWSVRNILKQDVSGDVAEEKFMAAREEVKTQIKSWQRSVMGQLARSLKPSGLSGLLALSIRRRHSLEPPAGLSTEFTPESEPHLQDPDLRKLLRADSVFQFGNGANTECLFFPDVVEIAQRELLVQQQQNRHYAYSDSDDENYRLEIEGYEYGYDRPAGLDLSRVSGHSYGIRVAKVLLACLGKPDATYLEMKSLGKRFICGRCWVRSPMTWVEMLAHWSQFATYHWPYSTETSLQQRGITCKEEHKISEPDYMQSTVEPESNDDDITLEDGARRHLIRLMTDEDIQAIENDGSPQFVCAVCDMVSGMHDGHGLGGKPIPKPKGTKEIIFGHLADVHSIPEEKWEKMAIAST